MNKKVWMMSGLILLLAMATGYIIWSVLAVQKGSDHVMDNPGKQNPARDSVMVKPLPDSLAQ